MKKESNQSVDYEIINGRKIVRKHVATIHCSNKLSLLERKISNVLLYHAYSNMKTENVHQITIDQLKRLLGANTRNHKALKNALKRLISTVIEWNLLGEQVPELELEGWNASTILSSVSVTDGVISYQYSELIKKLLIDPSIYGKINLVIQSRFKSSYSLALYENCTRYRGLKFTKEFSIEQFRKIMGVEEGKYEIFRDFNRRVLTPAVSEINTCSDIRIEPIIRRKGRKVTSIKFELSERSIKKRIHVTLNQQNDSALSDINSQLEKWGISEKQVQSWIDIHGKSVLKDKISYLKNSSEFKQGKINNIGGYLNSALKFDYKSNIENSPSPSSHIKGKMQYQKYIDDYMINKFHELDDVPKQTIINSVLDKYLTELSGKAVIAAYENNGVNGIIGEIKQYIQHHCPNLKDGALTYDEFLQQHN